MARTPNIRVPGRGAGRSIPQGYIIGRTSKGRGPLELINLNAAAGLGLATAQQVANATGGGGTSGNGQALWVKPLKAQFTARNPHNAVIADGVDGLVVANPGAVTNGLEPLGLTAGPPATPYDMCVRFALYSDGNNPEAGLFIRNSGTGHIITLGMFVNNFVISLVNQSWTGFSTGQGASINYVPSAQGDVPIWLRISNDGTTITFYVSTDGLDWVAVNSVLLAGFLAGTADDIGIYSYGLTSGLYATAVYQSFSTVLPTLGSTGGGAAGAAGATGPTGATGATGAAGSPGIPGLDGDEGAQGPPGSIGSQGPAGATGPAGVPGPVGPEGEEGPQGLSMPGPQGSQGAAGATGPQGPMGFAIDGLDAQEPFLIPGPMGATGASGATGPQGAVGRGQDGEDGQDGIWVPPWAAIGPMGATTLAVGGPLQGTDIASFYNGAAAATVEVIGDGQGAMMITSRYASDAVQPQFILRKARGSAASPSTVAANDVTGSWTCQGHDGTAFRGLANIQGRVNTVTGTNDISGDMAFLTRPDGAAAAATERLRIDKNGVFNVSANTIKILDQNGGFYGVQASAYSRQTPTTGFAITAGNGISFLILDPAGTLATGTITMPAAPLDGHEVTVSSSQIITALTVQANAGQTLDGGISAATFAANSFAQWKYVLAVTTWYRVG